MIYPIPDSDKIPVAQSVAHRCQKQGWGEIFSESIELEFRKADWLQGAMFARLKIVLATMFCMQWIIYRAIAGCFRERENVAWGDKNTLFVVYPENSTRSRHVVESLSGKKAKLLFVGRGATRSKLVKFTEKLADQSIDSSAWDIFLAPDIGGLSLECFRVLQVVSTRLIELNSEKAWSLASPRLLLGLMVRMQLANAYRRKLSTVPFPKRVVFGHTGVADSGAIDAIARGAKSETIHWFHGLTHGYNFYARSTQAMCQCGYDAEVTGKLGGYIDTGYEPIDMPIKSNDFRDDILVLSNYVHPQNPSFREHGCRDEINLLQKAVVWRDMLGAQRCDLLWKPHPVIDTLDHSDLEDLRKWVSQHGIQPIGQKMSSKEIAKFRRVLVTPSTMLVDVVRAGCLPVLDCIQPLPEFHLGHCVSENFRLLNIDQLPEIESVLSQDAEAKKHFDRLWGNIRPGKVGRDIVERRGWI